MDQSVAHRHRSVKFLAVIVRSVFLAVEIECSGNVLYGSNRRYHRLHALCGVLKRGGVYKWLERGTRLAMSQGMIQLAFAIIASANQGAYLPRARIHGNQRRLHLRNGLALLLPRGIALGQEFVYSEHPGLNRGASGALKLWIECGVDAIALRLEIGFRKLIEQMVFHHIHEIRRGAALNASADETKFLF